MAISKLAKSMLIQHNFTEQSSKDVQHITIHHCACVNASVEGMYNSFNNAARQASSNYFINSDGDIYCFVEEQNRAWTSSNAENDAHAITIEVANDGGAETNWHISEYAFNALIDLCCDICTRYSLEATFNDTKYATFNLHRHFTATQCPGQFIYSNMNKIVDLINRRIYSITKTFKDYAQLYYFDNVNKRWEEAVYNDNMAIIQTHHSISAIAFKMNCDDDIRYRVHTKKYGWLDYVFATDFDLSNVETGFAGLQDSSIDAIAITYLTKIQSNKDWLYAKYQTSLLINNDFLPIQIDEQRDSSQDGYAGIIGYSINGLKIKIER